MGGMSRGGLRVGPLIERSSYSGESLSLSPRCTNYNRDNDIYHCRSEAMRRGALAPIRGISCAVITRLIRR